MNIILRQIKLNHNNNYVKRICFNNNKIIKSNDQISEDNNPYLGFHLLYQFLYNEIEYNKYVYIK